MLIRLPAGLKEDLDWSSHRRIAQEFTEKGISILWHLDFGITPESFNPYETAHFFSYTLAIEHFFKKIWPEFQDKTTGLCLYEGSLKFSSNRSEKLSHFFDEFTQDYNDAFVREDLFELFSINLFSEYLHRLASFLPDNLSPYCMLDLSYQKSRAKIAQILSKRRFEHFELIVKGADIPIREKNFAPLGICLPTDEKLTPAAMKQLEVVLNVLVEKNTHFRIISEETLNEEWLELEELLIFPTLLTPQGKRMLKGFEAAGGTLKEIGAEGFEPPTHCSQSSCASQTALCSD